MGEEKVLTTEQVAELSDVHCPGVEYEKVGGRLGCDTMARILGSHEALRASLARLQSICDRADVASKTISAYADTATAERDTAVQERDAVSAQLAKTLAEVERLTKECDESRAEVLSRGAVQEDTDCWASGEIRAARERAEKAEWEIPVGMCDDIPYPWPTGKAHLVRTMARRSMCGLADRLGGPYDGRPKCKHCLAIERLAKAKETRR